MTKRRRRIPTHEYNNDDDDRLEVVTNVTLNNIASSNRNKLQQSRTVEAPAQQPCRQEMSTARHAMKGSLFRTRFFLLSLLYFVLSSNIFCNGFVVHSNYDDNPEELALGNPNYVLLTPDFPPATNVAGSDQHTRGESRTSMAISPAALSSTSRNLQDGENEPYQHGLVHIMDMGLDVPVRNNENKDDVLTANGITFTLKNEMLDQESSLMFLGLEVYLTNDLFSSTTTTSTSTSSTSDEQTSFESIRLQLFARVGEDHVNPLEDSSDNWTLLEEFILDADEFREKDLDATHVLELEEEEEDTRKNDLRSLTEPYGQYVSLPFQNSYEIPPNGAVTLFLFVEETSSIVVLKKPSQVSNMEDKFGGKLSIQSGSAIIRQQEQQKQEQLTPEQKQSPGNGSSEGSAEDGEENANQWIPVAAHAAFLGHIFYEFRGSPVAKPPPRQYRLDTFTSLVQQEVQSVDDNSSSTNDPYLYSQGIVFNVNSETGCNITYIEISTPLTTFMVMEIYTKKGSYSNKDEEKEKEDGGWTLISRAGIKGNGPNELTVIPFGQFQPVIIEPDETTAFYITSSQSSELISIPTSVTDDADVLEIGKTVYGVALKAPPSATQFATLDVQVGQPVLGYPALTTAAATTTADGNEAFGLLEPALLGTTPTIFRGQIYFAPIETETMAPLPAVTLAPTSPTASPPSEETASISPTNISSLNPELISQVKLTIQGVSRRTLRKLQESGGTMNNDAIRMYFEDVGKNFVNGFVNNGGGQDVPPIDVKNFVVSPDIDESDVVEERRVKRRLRGRYLQDDVSLDVYATVLGEYSPPPVVDFSQLTEDSFNDSGDEFIDELKTDPPPEVGDTFMNAQGIRAERAVFPKPDNLYDFRDAPIEMKTDDTPTESTTRDFLSYIYIVSGCGVALVLIIVTAAFMYRHGQQVQKHKIAQEEEERAMILARLENEVRENKRRGGGNTAVGTSSLRTATKSYNSNNKPHNQNYPSSTMSYHSRAATLATQPNSDVNYSAATSSKKKKKSAAASPSIRNRTYSGGAKSEITSSTYCASAFGAGTTNSSPGNFDDSRRSIGENFDVSRRSRQSYQDRGIVDGSSRGGSNVVTPGSTDEEEAMRQQRQTYSHYLRGHRGGTSPNTNRSTSRGSAAGTSPSTMASGRRSRTPTTASSSIATRSRNTTPFGSSRLERNMYYNELQQQQPQTLQRFTSVEEGDNNNVQHQRRHPQTNEDVRRAAKQRRSLVRSATSNPPTQEEEELVEDSEVVPLQERPSLPASRSLNSTVSEKYWSVSGRHIVSRSGRRVWDAVTGEAVQQGEGEGQQQQPQEHDPSREGGVVSEERRGSKYGMIVGDDDDNDGNDFSSLGTSGLGFDHASLDDDIDEEEEQEQQGDAPDKNKLQETPKEEKEEKRIDHRSRDIKHEVDHDKTQRRKKVETATTKVVDNSNDDDIVKQKVKKEESPRRGEVSKKKGKKVDVSSSSINKKKDQEERLKRQRRRIRKQRLQLQEELERE